MDFPCRNFELAKIARKDYEERCMIIKKSKDEEKIINDRKNMIKDELLRNVDRYEQISKENEVIDLKNKVDQEANDNVERVKEASEILIRTA